MSKSRKPAAAGSSPLARGTGGLDVLAVPAARFIPAGAGNSVHYRRRSPKNSVHPRWRGEQVRPLGAGVVVWGSSPLARGTDHAATADTLARRFIPAGAGNRPLTPAITARPPVHPR